MPVTADDYNGAIGEHKKEFESLFDEATQRAYNEFRTFTEFLVSKENQSNIKEKLERIYEVAKVICSSENGRGRDHVDRVMPELIDKAAQP